MRIAIMQPYFFPYLGYFQLINHVDKFVFYDDVNFIKGGWINRNRILINGKPGYFNAETSGASPNKKINEIDLNGNNSWRKKTLRKIEQNYSKAPYFDGLYDAIARSINYETDSLAEYAKNSIACINRYLNISTQIVHTSTSYKNGQLKGAARVVDICKSESAEVYVNPIGGAALYDKDHFKSHNLELLFLQPGAIKYQQGGRGFFPNLSIIDVLMRCSQSQVQEHLMAFQLL